MAVQSRAATTRQRILDVAVDLFVENGYTETGLKDITRATNLTTGAFYYHFRSKEELADAIIEQAWPTAIDLVLSYTRQPNAGLAQVIEMTFELAALFRRDTRVWIAVHLNQAFGHLSKSGRREFGERVDAFTVAVAAALSAPELRADVTPGQVADLAWSLMNGFQLQSDARCDDDAAAYDRLEGNWKVMLRALVPEASLPHFDQVLSATASHYGRQLDARGA